MNGVHALAVLLLAVVVCASAAHLPVFAAERLAFVGVALDIETREADRELRDYLYREAGVDFAPEELEYAQVVNRLSRWTPDDGHYLARTTPYVYVTSEMLGADFEILATYESTATGLRTYNAYFVVRRSDFPSEPELNDVIRFLDKKAQPARFVYHSEFSTSSYFLPSLFFRNQRIFNMRESTESLVAISSEKTDEESSTALVEAVAGGTADIAAVWEGTRTKFERSAAGSAFGKIASQVRFIRLPTVLPNDLLVCSRSLDAATKAKLQKALQGMGPDAIRQGDFRTWTSIREAPDARAALAELRWRARERIAPVTVDIRPHSSAVGDPAIEEHLVAARQALRLSGSEFVEFDEDFHEHIDFVWVLEPTHDGAILLHSEIPGSGRFEQTFQISFSDAEGLTKRIGSLIQSRIPRIRYVWPYSRGVPTVIRNTAAALEPGSAVTVQRIEWLDPSKNSFRGGRVFDVAVRSSDYSKYVLDPGQFRLGAGEFEFDAMSNVAYRVILDSPREVSVMLRALTLMFVALLAFVAAAGIVDARRERRRRDARSSSNPDLELTRSLGGFRSRSEQAR